MGMVTALDKFFEVFDNPQKDDLFFYYDGLRYQLSCCGRFIWTERTADGEDPWEYCIPGEGEEFVEAVLNAKVDRNCDKTIREMLAELPPEALTLG